MAGKNAKKATSTSSKIPPNKLPEIKPELVTLANLLGTIPNKPLPKITHHPPGWYP
jgi:hypothetical protein